jgi:hypothetical protein
LVLGRIERFPATFHSFLDEDVCQSNHGRSTAQIESSRACISRSPTWAVGAFNLFNSILAGIAVFVGGFAFGHWVTNSDPAFLRILSKSERYKPRYDAAKQQVPRVEVV